MRAPRLLLALSLGLQCQGAESRGKLSLPQGSPYWSVLHQPTFAKVDLLPDAEEEAARRPLLSLVMMVKNEAKSIGGTIDSVRPYVDRFTILDTGSDDNTVALIREHFGDTPGEVHHGAFTNYAESRNFVFHLEGTQSIFRLFLSGDEYLRNGAALRSWCEAHRHWRLEDGPAGEAFMVELLWGSGLRYLMPLVSRSNSRWYYQGVTHEFLSSPGGDNTDHLLSVRQGDQAVSIYRPGFSDLAEKPKRWRKDLALLLAAYHESDTPRSLRNRYAFYIGRTYSDLEQWGECFTWFRRRADATGWAEETYLANVYAARCAKKAGGALTTWPPLLQMLLDAHATMPDRAEALHAIGEHYFRSPEHGSEHLALLFLKQAHAIPFPQKHVLFSMRSIYDWSIPRMLVITASRTGDHVVALETARKALKVLPKENRHAAKRAEMEHAISGLKLALAGERGGSIIVTGAGSDAVNGEFRPHGSYKGAKQFIMSKHGRTFELFRASTNPVWWNIQERAPDGKYLSVHYGVTDPMALPVPPASNWVGVNNKASWRGALPPPQITMVDSLVGDSDNDDDKEEL